MAAAQDYEPDAVRQRFAQQITYERTWLPDLFRSHLCVITRIDYNAEDCLWIGYTNERRSLLKPVSERAEVSRRLGVGRRDQGMAKSARREFVGNLDKRLLMAMAPSGDAAVLAIAKAVVEYRHRSWGQFLGDTSRKHRLSDAAYSVYDDRASVSLDY